MNWLATVKQADIAVQTMSTNDAMTARSIHIQTATNDYGCQPLALDARVREDRCTTATPLSALRICPVTKSMLLFHAMTQAIAAICERTASAGPSTPIEDCSRQAHV